jgi:transposase-like protein
MVDTADMSLVKLIELFRDDETCRLFLEYLRWPDGVVRCPRCGSRASVFADRNQFDCNAEECRYRFSVTAGTIFHDSKLPLYKWFIAVYLMTDAKKGISARQLGRNLSVTYKTAWYLCHRIRAAMKEHDSAILSGIVEADETFIGGKRRGVGSGNMVGKSIVAGARQRGGAVRLDVISDRKAETLKAFLARHVADEALEIHTDEHNGYTGVSDGDTAHKTVNHAADEWDVGNVHTNSVESAWSLLKRAIVGAYHKVSVKHLEAYLDELEWRFTNRENPHLFRDTLLKLIDADRLTYRELVEGQAA